MPFNTFQLYTTDTSYKNIMTIRTLHKLYLELSEY